MILRTEKYSGLACFVLLLLLAAGAAMANPIPFYIVTFGESWDGVSLQEVLDAEYGPGLIPMESHMGALVAYWEDDRLDAILVREIAGHASDNILGWYQETFAQPVVDGVSSGVIFEGPELPGATRVILFPAGVTRFGFYLNPNGLADSNNAPEPELFFSNPMYNDVGPDGSGPIRPDEFVDVQCLVYDISHLRNGLPTYVLAWEDLDSGAEITPTSTPDGTDNDFQDLVVEISAFAVVPNATTSWGQLKALYGD